MKLLLKSLILGLSLIAGSQATDQRKTYSLSVSPPDIQSLICQTTATVCFSEMSYSDSREKLYFLMKNFFYDKNEGYTVNGNWFKNAILSGYAANGVCEKDYENCLIFLNGKLKYTPDEGEPIFLPIADLKNPFSGEFDLSKCGDARIYLSINTGCRKENKNNSKVEIWFTPWFSVEKNLDSTASHLKSIFADWNHSVAPIGIFWNWGNWDNLDWYEYLTTCDVDAISSDDILKLYSSARVHLRTAARVCDKHRAWRNFHVHFKRKSG